MSRQVDVRKTATETPLSIRLLIAALLVIYYLILPGQHSPWLPGEAKIAEISREMLINHDWLNPHFLGVPSGDKSLVLYWLNALGQRVFGHTLFAVRAGSVMSILLSSWLINRLTWRIWQDRNTARMACVIFMTTLLVYKEGTYAFQGPVIALCLLFVMWGGWLIVSAPSVRSRYFAVLVIGLACGLGGIVGGAALLFTPLVAALLWSGQKHPIWVLCVLILFIPAIAYVNVNDGVNPEVRSFCPWLLMTGGVTYTNGQGGQASFWALVTVFLGGTLPWAALIPGACLDAWRQRQRGRENWYLICCTLSPLLSFVVFKGELLRSLLPCCVPLSMLIARYVMQRVENMPHVLRVNGWFNLVGGGLCAVGMCAVLFPLNHTGNTVYRLYEIGKGMLIVTALLAWSMTGVIALLPSARGWVVAAFCPLALVLIVDQALPDRVISARTANVIASQLGDTLSRSRYILTDDVNLASGLAWELGRSDILLYGRAAPSGSQGSLDASSLSDWLRAHRQDGDIIVVLAASSPPPNPDDPAGLPYPDSHSDVRGAEVSIYRQQP